MTPIIKIFDQNFGHFGGYERSFLTLLLVKKLFSGLFPSCLGSVWALFLTLKGLLLGIFSAPKVYK